MYRLLILAMVVIVLAVASFGYGSVYTYEADTFPDQAGFILLQNYCDTLEWVEDGCFYQFVDECPGDPLPGGQASNYDRSVSEFVGTERMFVTWRMETDGSSDQIPFGAPASFAVGSGGGSVRYTFFIATDLVKLNRDNDLPIINEEFEPGPHVFYLDLDNTGGTWFRFFVDSKLITEGVTEGVYPSGTAPHIGFGAWMYLSSSTVRWHYMRWGDRPPNGSADFDGNGQIDDLDFYYFADYFSGENIEALPGALWADLDFDGDVDCTDAEAFAAAWTGPGDAPVFEPCVPAPIPAVSQWGVVMLTLLMVAVATIVYGRSRGHRCLRGRAG